MAEASGKRHSIYIYCIYVCIGRVQPKIRGGTQTQIRNRKTNCRKRIQTTNSVLITGCVTDGRMEEEKRIGETEQQQQKERILYDPGDVPKAIGKMLQTITLAQSPAFALCYSLCWP